MKFEIGEIVYTGEIQKIIEIDLSQMRVLLEVLGGANDGEQKWWAMETFKDCEQ